MSKFTRTEGLVLLILALGTVCFFNGTTRQASGAEAFVLSVVINGQDLTSQPSTIVEARLRTSLEINVTWRMWYDNESDNYGWMNISLYNSTSIVRESAQFKEIGLKNNRVWNCPLVPEEWTLAKSKEYGRVEVVIFVYDGVEGTFHTKNYTILILPEWVGGSSNTFDATAQAWTLTAILLAAIFGVMISIRHIKRVRHGFLSKEQFTVTVA